MDNSLQVRSQEIDHIMEKLLADSKAELAGVEESIEKISHTLATEAELKTDLSENASAQLYKDTRDMQQHAANLLRNRIEALSNYAVDYTPVGYITLGTTVEARLESINGKAPRINPNVFTFKICVHDIGDAELGLVAIDSEVGRKMLGHRAGDTIEAVTKKGVLQYRIERIY